MSQVGQFKNFSTRKMRADLHYRLKLLAARTKLKRAQEETAEAELKEMEAMMDDDKDYGDESEEGESEDDNSC